MAYSIQTAVSDGTLEVLDLSIKYMDKSHIFVYVDDVLVEGSAYSYVWLTDTRIQLVPAVANGSTIKVIRKTLTDEMWHEFSKGARFSTTSMDENFEQLLFLAQEYSEGIYISDFYSDVDLHLKRILNLGDPINDADAVNLKTLKEYLPNADLIPPILERIAEEEAKSAQIITQGLTLGDKVITGFDGTTLEHNAWVHFAGRDTIGDGGGGSLRFLKGSTATANGVTIYAVTGGRLVREGWSVFGINVRWAGAKGDGVTDDTSAIQAAINVAVASIGGVFIPAGDYVLSSGLIVTSSVSIGGAMQGTTEMPTRLLCSASGILIERSAGADNVVGVHLSNLRIDKTGTAKAAGSYGVKLVGANSNITMRNVEARYFEKNWWLRGVIGAQLFNISGRAGAYGLYTESHSTLSYDTTNCDFYGAKFADQNDTGVYLGPLTQGVNFFGGDVERNTVGVQFANTAPASGAINFYGTWFEANGTHWLFSQKPTPVTFDGCYIYGGAAGGTTLWSNGGSGTITATVQGCKLSATMAVDMDIFNGVWEQNRDDGTLTYSATEPNGYYFQRLANTSFSIGGKTLYNVENIGAGRYQIWASGTPASSGFVVGSKWVDVATGIEYLNDGVSWKKQFSVIETSVTYDFASIPAQSTANTLITVTGAAAGDPVVLGINGTPPNGIIFSAVATATNSVRIYAHNFTGAAIDPASFTFNIKVLK